MSDLKKREEYFNRILEAHKTLSLKAGLPKKTLIMPPPWLDIVRLAGFEIEGSEELRESYSVSNVRPQASLIPGELLLTKQNVISTSDIGSAKGLNFVSAHEVAHLLLGKVRVVEPREYTSHDEYEKYMLEFNEVEQEADLLAYELLLPEFFFKILAGDLCPFSISMYCLLDVYHVLNHTLQLSDTECQLSIYNSAGLPIVIMRKRPDFVHSGLFYTLSNRISSVKVEDLSDTALVVYDRSNRIRINKVVNSDLLEFLKFDEYLGVTEVVHKILAENKYNILNMLLKDAEDDEKNILIKFMPVCSVHGEEVKVDWVFVLAHPSPVFEWKDLVDVTFAPWHELIKSSDYSKKNNVGSWLNKIRGMMGLEPKRYSLNFDIRRDFFQPSDLGFGTEIEFFIQQESKYSPRKVLSILSNKE